MKKELELAKFVKLMALTKIREGLVDEKDELEIVWNSPDGFIVFSMSGHQGIVDNEWNVIAQPEYEAFSTYSYFVMNKRHGEYDLFSDDRLAAKKDGKWGFINKKGEVVIPFKYEYVLGFAYGCAVVQTDQRGVINNLNVLIDVNGKEVSERCDCIFCVPPYASYYEMTINYLENDTLKYKEGLCSFDGKEVIPIIYSKIETSSCYSELETFASTQELDDAKRAFMEGAKTREEGLRDFYKQRYFVEGYALVQRDEKWGYRSVSGEEHLGYDRVGFFHNGLAIVRRDGKNFIINQRFERVSGEYDEIEPFVEGMAIVRQGGKSGYIDASFREVVAPEYDSADCFYKGSGRVSVGDDSCLIDKAGGRVSDFYKSIYLPNDLIRNYDDRICITYDGSKYGLMDISGKVLLKPTFDDVRNEWDIAPDTDFPLGFDKKGDLQVLTNGEWTTINLSRFPGHKPSGRRKT